jgi:RNA 3'-terminal phosphate cyclase (ATP)
MLANYGPTMKEPNQPILLDGAVGEGGGQILRTGLALSAVGGLPVEIVNIRARRSRPGLAAQHLAGVRAVSLACDGHLEGDYLGSDRVALIPGEIRAGEYELDVAAETPSAGAVTLVMQALLPVLALASGPSRVLLKGGTHVDWSPSFHYFDQVLRPALAVLGVHFQPRLLSWGWYPRGGGKIEVDIAGTTKLSSIDWTARGPLRSISGVSVVSGLPAHIAERQARAARHLLTVAVPEVPIDIAEESIESTGRGSFCFLRADYDGESDRAERDRGSSDSVNGKMSGRGEGASQALPCGFSALGRRGKRAEAVGEEAAAALLAHHKGGASLEDHLADQVLPFLALASGSSRYTTPQVSSHLRTNAWVCEKLMDIRVGLHENQPCTVEVHGTGMPR